MKALESTSVADKVATVALLPADCPNAVDDRVISVGASLTGTTATTLLILGATVLLLVPESVNWVRVTVRAALPGLSLLLP